jgi:prepilin-type processing-associated H-X9-DG protein
MRRIAWSVYPTFLAAVAVLCATVTVTAGPGLPEEEEATPRPRGRDDDSRTTTLLPTAATPVGAVGAGAIIQTEARRLRTAEVTPRDALLYVLVPEISRFDEGYGASAVAKILNLGPFQRDIAATLDSIRTAGRMSRRRGLAGFLEKVYAVDVDYRAVRGVFRKEIAFIALKPAKGSEEVRYAFAGVVGMSREPLDEAIDGLMGEIQMQYPQFTAMQRKHRGEKVKTLQSASFQISCAYYENLFLIGTGPDAVSELIDVHVTGENNRLATDSAFKAAEADLGKGASVMYRADAAGIVSILKDVAAETPVQSLLAATANQFAGTLWGAIHFAGEAIRERIEFRTAKPAADGMAADALAVPPKTVGYFPVDTALYVAASVDPSRAINRMLEDPNTPPMFAVALAGVSEAVGAKIESDILPAFGGEIAIGLIMPPGLPPELLLAVEIKRPEMYNRATEAIDRFLGGNVSVKQFRDFTVRFVPPAKPQARASVMAGLMPDPAYVRAGDMFLFASTTRGLEKAVRQYQHRRASLIEKADFARSTGALRPRRTSLLYVDTAAILTGLTGQIPTYAGTAISGPLAGVPEAELAIPSLFGFGLVADESPVLTVNESYGPLGPISGGVMVLAVGMRQSESESGGRRAIEDKDNLRRIGVALHLYATDFDRFPVSLSELYAPQYLQDLKAFEAPGGKGGVNTKDDIDTRSDYVYVNGLTPVSLSDAIIVYDKLHVLGGTERNVLFLDGNVETIPEATFRMMMKAQGGDVVD